MQHPGDCACEISKGARRRTTGNATLTIWGPRIELVFGPFVVHMVLYFDEREIAIFHTFKHATCFNLFKFSAARSEAFENLFFYNTQSWIAEHISCALHMRSERIKSTSIRFWVSHLVETRRAKDDGESIWPDDILLRLLGGYLLVLSVHEMGPSVWRKGIKRLVRWVTGHMDMSIGCRNHLFKRDLYNCAENVVAG